MDLLAVLEGMAVNASEDNGGDFEPSEEMVNKWQTLFKYSYAEAVEQIKKDRNDYCRQRVSDDHWDMVLSRMEAQGFDREAYEHWLRICDKPVVSDLDEVDLAISQPGSVFLIKLEGILSTPEKVQEIASLSEPPTIDHGVSDTGEASLFCRVTGDTKQTLARWLSKHHPTFSLTFIPLNLAKKDLSPDSIYPTLGRDSTLPQYRQCPLELRRDIGHHHDPAASSVLSYSVLQDDYPVWYFFYGTLAEIPRLRRLLSLPESEIPIMFPAKIRGGLIKSWQGQYKALVDGADTDIVHGSAYKVTSEDREVALRLYETKHYEVVRCTITLASHTVQGLTFRFVGLL
ncbi:MAG: hypothetical protein Q9181_004550 [Wetmoreana brouardii]